MREGVGLKPDLRRLDRQDQEPGGKQNRKFANRQRHQPQGHAKAITAACRRGFGRGKGGEAGSGKVGHGVKTYAEVTALRLRATVL